VLAQGIEPLALGGLEAVAHCRKRKRLVMAALLAWG